MYLSVVWALVAGCAFDVHCYIFYITAPNTDVHYYMTCINQVHTACYVEKAAILLTPVCVPTLVVSLTLVVISLASFDDVQLHRRLSQKWAAIQFDAISSCNEHMTNSIQNPHCSHRTYSDNLTLLLSSLSFGLPRRLVNRQHLCYFMYICSTFYGFLQ